jgi:hypothetical protein
VGVAVAPVTRAARPFPSEIAGPDHERVRELGQEFGTVTGRERRCGWLDLVALRFAVRVNGITSLALTKIDVLSEFAELPVCVRYALQDGSETEHFPAHQSDFHHCRPVFETLSGWETDIGSDGLPKNALEYVAFVGLPSGAGDAGRDWRRAGVSHFASAAAHEPGAGFARTARREPEPFKAQIAKDGLLGWVESRAIRAGRSHSG